jgi:hypothetical protein
VKSYESALVAFLLTATVAVPSAAQKASFPPEASASEPCAEYFGCLEYGTLTEAQARTARGHPLFVEPQTTTTSLALQSSAAPDRALPSSPIMSSPRR